MAQAPFPVHGIFLRRRGDYAVVEVDLGGGNWVEVIRELVEGPFSHIVEPAGIRGVVERHQEKLGAVR